MPTLKLTQRTLLSIKPSATRTYYYDETLRGFGLLVTPAGGMSWIVEYRPGVGGRGTTKRRMTLGKSTTLTPEQARTLAKQILARVQAGEDPAAEKAELKKAETVAELCDLYLEEADRGAIISRRGAPKKASTLATDRGRIARHIKPLLGKKLARSVTRSDIERFLRDVAAGKTATDEKTKKHGRAIVTGGKGTATRTVRLLGGIFSYAIRIGVRADNPTHGVAKYADGQGARFLDSAELERLGDALREAETVGIPWDIDPEAPGAKHLPKDYKERRVTIAPHPAAAIRLLILTGCRLREILNLEWRSVDLERGLLNLPDSKTGPRFVILSAPAMEILSNLPRIKDCPYVILGEDQASPRSDLKRPWALVTRAAGLEGVRLHDLRHTFASHGALTGMGLLMLGKLLGHADLKTTVSAVLRPRP